MRLCVIVHLPDSIPSESGSGGGDDDNVRKISFALAQPAQYAIGNTLRTMIPELLKEMCS